MNPIASILNEYPVLVIDGTLANELERRKTDQPNLEHRQRNLGTKVYHK